MTHINTKGKAQAKRKELSRRVQWEKALMTVRKLKKSADQGNSDATVVVGKNMVVIRTNPAHEFTRFQKYLEHHGNTQEGIVYALNEAKNRATQSLHKDLSNAENFYLDQVKLKDLTSAYKNYEEREQSKNLFATCNLLTEQEKTREFVDAYHFQLEQAKYKELINAYYNQVQQHVENHQADRERFVRTLKESPTDEAMDFYRSIGY